MLRDPRVTASGNQNGRAGRPELGEENKEHGRDGPDRENA